MVCRPVYNSICGLQASLQQYLWSSGQSTTVSVVCRQVYNRVCGKVTPKAGSAGKSRDKRPVQSQQVSAKVTSTVSQPNSPAVSQPNSPEQSTSQTHQHSQPNPPAQSVSQTHQHSQLAKPTSTVSQRTENYDKSDFQNFDLQPSPPPPPPPPMVTHRGYEYEAC